MGAGEIRVDLSHLATAKNVAGLDLERSPLGIAPPLSASILAGGDEFLVNFRESLSMLNLLLPEHVVSRR
jgi:hypothetical protein